MLCARTLGWKEWIISGLILFPNVSWSGAGVILCIEKALAQSGVSREDVNYINAHATSTQAGDLKEYQALLHCFGHNKEVYFNDNLVGVINIFGP